MRHLLLRSAIVIAVASCASVASAQQTVNPMGLDLGALHSWVSSPLPTQVTTYEPPLPTPSSDDHRSVRGPRYAHRSKVHMATTAN